MKALLWKDWRENRKLFIALAVFATIPYFIVSVAFTVDQLANPNDALSSREIARGIGDAAAGGILFTVVWAVFLGGNAFAGERADRSADFLASLPLDRRQAAMSKAIVGLGLVLILWAVNAVVFVMCNSVSHDYRGNALPDFLSGSIIIAASMFSAAWLFSSFTRSSGIATFSGLAVAFLYTFSVWVVPDIYYSSWGSQRKIDEIVYWSVVWAGPLGILCLVAGAAVYLRRVEP